MEFCHKFYSSYIMRSERRVWIWSFVINFSPLTLWEVNVEFGYGHMKGVHRKRILKNLKVDLYIYSNSYTKKKYQNVKKQESSKKEKVQYQKLKIKKFFLKFDAKNRFSGRKNEIFLLKNTEKLV